MWIVDGSVLVNGYLGYFDDKISTSRGLIGQYFRAAFFVMTRWLRILYGYLAVWY